MTIEVLISFVDRDSLTGKLTSYAQGDVVRNLSDEVANAFISAGLARAYTNLGVAGNISITANGQYDVADYAGATVNVPDFKNLVDKSITSVTADMLAGVTKIGDLAFIGCTNLTSATIPGSVLEIGGMAFSQCGLTSLTISDGVTKFGEQTFAATPLTSVTIPSSVTDFGSNAFSGCSYLESVTLSNGIESIGNGIFSDCTSLTSIEIPDSVTSIGDEAFFNCYLVSVTMNATIPPTLGRHAFSNNDSSNLIIYVPSESVDAYKAASNWSTYADKIQAISE